MIVVYQDMSRIDSGHRRHLSTHHLEHTETHQLPPQKRRAKDDALLLLTESLQERAFYWVSEDSSVCNGLVLCYKEKGGKAGTTACDHAGPESAVS